MEFEELSIITEELEKFAEIEGSEAGEYWNALVHMSSYTDLMDAGFREDFCKEIKETLEYVKSHFKIVEKEITLIRTVFDLEEI